MSAPDKESDMGAVAILGLMAIFSEGFVGMWLWRWFVMPATNWPAIGYWHAMGLAMLAGLWTHQMPYGETTSTVERSTGVLLVVWLAFAMGWAFHFGVAP